MKKTEKIFLVTSVIIFGLTFFNFGIKNAVFTLILLVLAGFYSIGAYRLFSLPKKYSFLSVFSGIAFALSFIAIIYGFYINKNAVIIKLLPLPNLLLFSGLLVVFFLFKIKKKNFNIFQSIFIRSVIIALVASFFIYLPVSSKFYRTIMYGMNNGNWKIRHNLEAHHYVYEFEKYHKEGDCDKAIESVENSLKKAMSWIDKDYNRFSKQLNDYINQNSFTVENRKNLTAL